MIAYSKSAYITRHPDNQAYFNANVFTDNGKVWWGDLDLKYDSEKLQSVADELRTDLYVLSEMDGRFYNGSRPLHELKKLAVKKFTAKSNKSNTFNKWQQSLVYKAKKFFSAMRRQ